MLAVKEFVDEFLLKNLDGASKDFDESAVCEPTRLIFLAGNKPVVLFRDVNLNRSSFVWKLNSLLTMPPFYRVVRDEASGTVTLIQTRHITKRELLALFTDVFKAINFLHGSKEAIKAIDQYAVYFLAATHKEFDYVEVPEETYLSCVKSSVYNEETGELEPTVFYFYDPFKVQQLETLLKLDFGLDVVPHVLNRANEKVLLLVRRYASMYTIDLPSPDEDEKGVFLKNVEEVLWN